MLLRSTNIYLRKTLIKDAKKSTKWLNDESVNMYLSTKRKITIKERGKFLREHLNAPSERTFSIIVIDSNKYIGNIYLYNINKTNHVAEIGVFIGEKSYLRKGFSTEAINLVTDFGFQELGLIRIYAKIIKENIPSILCFNKCGFQLEKNYLSSNQETILLSKVK